MDKTSKAGAQSQAASGPANMLVTVRRVTGKCVVVDMGPEDTVAALKARLSEATGIAAADQLLTLCGAVVRDSVTLASLGIEHHSVLQLAIKRSEAAEAGEAAAGAPAGGRVVTASGEGPPLAAPRVGPGSPLYSQVGGRASGHYPTRPCRLASGVGVGCAAASPAPSLCRAGGPATHPPPPPVPRTCPLGSY